MASLTTREDLEDLIGARKVVEIFDDDGDGQIAGRDLQALNKVLAEANDHATSLVLLKGWTEDELNGLSRDHAIRLAATQLAAQFAGERRPGFFDSQGNGLFTAMGKRGRDYLKGAARGETRSRLEGEHGRNRSTRGRRSTAEPSSVFARNPNDPNDQPGNDGRGF
jgi:hypothetical protein